MPNYHTLRVYELAQELSEEVHLLVAKLPSRKAPGLSAQLCKAVESVPANIAEGAGRDSQSQYVKFLLIARGSAQEASVHLRLAARIDETHAAAFIRWQRRAEVVAGMLTKLVQRIREDEANLRENRGNRSATAP